MSRFIFCILSVPTATFYSSCYFNIVFSCNMYWVGRNLYVIYGTASLQLLIRYCLIIYLLSFPISRSLGKQSTFYLTQLVFVSSQPSLKMAFVCGSSGPNNANTWTSRGAADGSWPPPSSSSTCWDNLVVWPWFFSDSVSTLPAVSSSQSSAFR